MRVFGNLVVWGAYGVGITASLGLPTEPEIAIGSSWSAIIVLYITSAVLNEKNLDPNFWVPDE